MTLNTRIYVRDEVDPHELFAVMRQIIGAGSPDYRYVDRLDDFRKDGRYWLRGIAGQGYPALLDMHYRTDGPLRPDDVWDEDFRDPAAHVEASMDTGHSYRDEHGGCGNLHARLLAQLGVWLRAHSVRWLWQNEFTGELHDGGDVRRYADLVDSGDEAAQWLESVVLPSLLPKGRQA